MEGSSAMFAAMPGAEHTTFGPIELDVVRVGDARIKRIVYPAGTHWADDLGPLVGTETCRHAHVGFLAHGALRFEYPDGCRLDFAAPSVVDVAPGHDAWVVGDEPAVLIEVDFEADTINRLGLAAEHRH